MPETYFLPPRTSELIEKHGPHCKNLGLILDKYLPQYVINDSKNKGPWLKNLGQVFDAELLHAASLRWQAMLSKFQTTQFTAPLAWRMIVGLGGESVLETAMTLHHVYGVPFIPGSALKGLTRAYAASEDETYFVTDTSTGKRGPSPEAEKDHEELQRVFGSQERAGSVLFFDALPQDGHVSLVVDLMNPHYPDYYNSLKSNPKPPTNDQSPNPITFLTVAETAFTFALAPRNPDDKEHLEDVKLAQGWLKLALQRYGVGSKTSAGYGYFTIESQQKTSTPPLPAAQEAAPLPYIRPNIPRFNTGQVINTLTVVAPTEELRKRAPEAKAFLRYREFSTKLVLIIVEAEETASWTPGQTKNCVFVREEERDGCTVLICQPSVSKSQQGVSKKKKG